MMISHFQHLINLCELLNQLANLFWRLSIIFQLNYLQFLFLIFQTTYELMFWGVTFLSWFESHLIDLLNFWGWEYVPNEMEFAQYIRTTLYLVYYLLIAFRGKWIICCYSSYLRVKWGCQMTFKNVPHHDKTNKVECTPSEDSAQSDPPSPIRVFAVRMKKAWALNYQLSAHGEDSDQTGLIWVFAGRTCHFVGFVRRRLKCSVIMVFHIHLGTCISKIYTHIVSHNNLRVRCPSWAK